jgi:stearoyl-CoA desaturase (delta-9 desaturase)
VNPIVLPTVALPEIAGHRLQAPEPVSVGTRLATLTAVVLPFVGLVGGIVLFWGTGIQWAALGLFAGFAFLTGLGITVGYHRLFTHRSFQTNPVIEFIFAVLGSMAVQGDVIKWVAIHRRHHQHSDAPGDPHSPHNHGGGAWGVLRGFWHAHIGWFFRQDPVNLNRYVKDLQQSAMLRWVSYLFPLWILLGLVIPCVAGGLLIGGWQGYVLGLCWGGFARVFFVHHYTWSINSICHIWGSQPYPGIDQSKNNTFIGITALGEGWHNNHHAFPTSARHGLKWWQIDISYMLIRTLELLGLAWNVKVPAKEALHA